MSNVIDVNFGRKDGPPDVETALRNGIAKTLEEVGFHSTVRPNVSALVAEKVAELMRDLQRLPACKLVSIDDTLPPELHNLIAHACQQFEAEATKRFVALRREAELGIVSAAIYACAVMATSDRLGRR